MSLQSKYNLKNPGVKRLMREACELAEPTDEYHASPLEDNLFEWHFTVRGSSNTEFEGGIYHGRILLPLQYPMEPPNIILLTPNGRFETNKKICLSISGYHPESWQPSWSIRTALLALIAFMPTPATGTIGALDYTPEERTILAKKSTNWECDICGKISEKLSNNHSKSSPSLSQEETSLLKQIALKAEEDSNKKIGDDENDTIINNDNNSNETEVKDSVHHRQILRNPSITDTTPIRVTTENLSNSTFTKDSVWRLIIFILFSVICILVFRRLYLL